MIQEQEVQLPDSTISSLIEQIMNKFLNQNKSTFIKQETTKSEELNYYVPEKWDYQT